MLDDNFALVVEGEVLDPGGHLFLVLLELMEVVQVVKHRCDKENEVQDDPEIWLAALIVLKHDQTVMVPLLSLQNRCVSLRHLLVGILAVLTRQPVTLRGALELVSLIVVILERVI